MRQQGRESEITEQSKFGGLVPNLVVDSVDVGDRFVSFEPPFQLWNTNSVSIPRQELVDDFKKVLFCRTRRIESPQK